MAGLVKRGFGSCVSLEGSLRLAKTTFTSSDLVYRDIDSPKAALFHIRTADLERAQAWFGSDKFRQATRRATVTGREFYIAEQQL